MSEKYRRFSHGIAAASGKICESIGTFALAAQLLRSWSGESLANQRGGPG
jgi:hypothetical protein